MLSSEEMKLIAMCFGLPNLNASLHHLNETNVRVNTIWAVKTDYFSIRDDSSTLATVIHSDVWVRGLVLELPRFEPKTKSVLATPTPVDMEIQQDLVIAALKNVDLTFDTARFTLDGAKKNFDMTLITGASYAQIVVSGNEHHDNTNLAHLWQAIVATLEKIMMLQRRSAI